MKLLVLHSYKLIHLSGLLPTRDQRMKGCGCIFSWKKNARMTLTRSITIFVTRVEREAAMNIFFLSPTTAGSHIAVRAAFNS